jgi:hypothetical protein
MLAIEVLGPGTATTEMLPDFPSHESHIGWANYGRPL